MEEAADGTVAAAAGLSEAVNLTGVLGAANVSQIAEGLGMMAGFAVGIVLNAGGVESGTGVAGASSKEAEECEGRLSWRGLLGIDLGLALRSAAQSQTTALCLFTTAAAALFSSPTQTASGRGRLPPVVVTYIISAAAANTCSLHYGPNRTEVFTKVGQKVKRLRLPSCGGWMDGNDSAKCRTLQETEKGTRKGFKNEACKVHFSR